MDLDEIVEVKELADIDRVNEYLGVIEEDWILIEVAPGQKPDKMPCFLYLIGRRRSPHQQLPEQW